MHVGAKLFELLLVLHPEVLLLVDDDQAQVLEADLLGQHGVGAHHDLDLAAGQAVARLGRFLGRDQAREAPHPHRPALEALGESLEVLAGQERRGRNDRHLLAAHGHHEGGAQGHFGLAEAHVAADEPVHRPAGAQVFQHVADGAQLVVGLLVGEPGAELVEQALRRLHGVGLFGGPLGGDADQAVGHLSQAFLGLGLARLPRRPAQTVELHALAVGAVAGEQVDVLDRQVQLGLAAVLQLERVVRRALDVEGLQALVSGDTVFVVHDEVAGRQR